VAADDLVFLEASCAGQYAFVWQCDSMRSDSPAIAVEAGVGFDVVESMSVRFFSGGSVRRCRFGNTLQPSSCSNITSPSSHSAQPKYCSDCFPGLSMSTSGCRACAVCAWLIEIPSTAIAGCFAGRRECGRCGAAYPSGQCQYSQSHTQCRRQLTSNVLRLVP
jgi:hypothetical protein